MADNYYNKISKFEDLIINDVNSKDMMKHTQNIAKFVRLSGTNDEVKSLEYIKSELQKYGFDTRLSFFDAFISNPIRSSVELLYPKNLVFESITHSFSASTHSVGLNAEVVDKLCPCVEGKIVMAKGLPNANEVMNFQNLGAVAVLYAQDEHLHNGPVSNIWGSPTRDTEDLLVKIPVISIKRNDGKLLEEFISKNRTRIKLECEVDTGWMKIPMLEAEIKSNYSDEFILLSSHIDSWDYGAMDNGSANATTLEIARLMSIQKEQLLRGLKIIFWSGHSQGKFFGSAWYADNYWEELLDNCLGHVYVDSTGGKDAVIITEAPVMPQTKGLATEIIKKQTGEDFVGKRIGHFADQSFYGIGLTSIFGTFSEQDALLNSDVLSFKTGPVGGRAGGLGWWWHTKYDTIDKIDEEFLTRDTKIYVATVWRLLTYPILPYDFRCLVKEIEDTALSLQKKLKNRFDLNILVSRIDLLKNAMDTFYEEIGDISNPSEKADNVNEIFKKLSHNLVRITFVEKDCFDFDLSGTIFPLSSLYSGIELSKTDIGSHRFNILRTEFQRGLNRTMYYLRNALEVLQNYN